MASLMLMLVSLSLIIFNLILLPLPSTVISSCNGRCKTLKDCAGQLICIKGKCNDDPDVGTHTCRGGGGSSPPDNCKSSGTFYCKGKSYLKYTCSPPVTSSTKAKLTLNNSVKVGMEGVHRSVTSDSITTLSGCGKIIRITASNGKSVTARVVDECDSRNGCDAEHAGLPPCGNNIIDGSAAVWNALQLNQDLGVVDVTWSMA
ncbi:unnamed protein product [Prunus armeniaca]|uniref:Kiwellin-like n=1 Tax=Prunus armeniaca TaxID=36596 RepID=A0A6J5XGL9_PRUAR|nr:unnamed protein product [Prunus armeniaca]